MSQILIENQSSQFTNTFSLQKRLSSNKFPIYQAIDGDTDRQVVIKIFPKKSNMASISYEKETNFFQKLIHPHIIRLIRSSDSSQLNLESGPTPVSFLLLELAQNGDLFDAISQGGAMSEVLARTVFHQLVDGISFMHNMNIAHLDLKPENILLDENFTVKITDFDLAQNMDGQTRLDGRGTVGYRAPEIREGRCSNLVAADIYSLGVILFIMLAGIPPYMEVEKGFSVEYDGFYKLLRKNTQKFWEIHGRHSSGRNLFKPAVIKLITAMLSEDPNSRPTIDEIKQNSWYNGEVLSQEAYKTEMEKYFRRQK